MSKTNLASGNRHYFRFWAAAGLSLLMFVGANSAMAAVGLGSVAATITSSMSNLALMITALSYVAGFGFAGAGILKFKAHKDNPTQITLGAPITLLFVGAALIFLPAIFGATGKTLFGSSTTGTGGVSGVTGFQ